MSVSGHLGDALSALLDGEIAPAARREAEAHLGVCGECRAELALVADARSAVRALPVRPLPGPWEALGESMPSRVGRPARRAAWAAVAAAAAVVALLLPHEQNVKPELTQRVDSHVARASVDSDPLSTLAPIAVPVSFGR